MPAWLMHSLRAWCLTTRLGACLQTKPWTPVASTKLPQRQVCGLPSSEPSLSATAIRMALSSSRNPQAVIGSAKSQSPLCGARAARRLARCKIRHTVTDRIFCVAIENNDVDDDDEYMNAAAAHAAFVMTVSAPRMYWLLRYIQHAR